MLLQTQRLTGLLLLALSLVAASSVSTKAPPQFLLTWGWGVQDGSSALQVCTSACQAGSIGSGDGQFYFPMDVEVDATGNVYVADTINHRIQKFDASYTFLRAWGWGVQDGSSAFQVCTSGCQAGTSGSNTGQFDTLYGAGVDAAGNVYVADTYNNRIQKFDSDGTFLFMWGWGVEDGTAELQVCTSNCQKGIPDGGGDGQMAAPTSVAIDSAGNVYVPSYARIQKFDSNAAFLLTWGWGVEDGTAELQVCTSNCRSGIEGGGDGQLEDPYGITVDATGNVYVADTINHRIQKFDKDSNFVRTWGWGVQDGSPEFQICTSGCRAGLLSGGDGDGQFAYPRDLEVDALGNVYVIDEENHRIQKFDASGNFVTKWGTNGGGEGEFYAPIGIAVDAIGNVYVTDTHNHRIQKFGEPEPPSSH